MYGQCHLRHDSDGVAAFPPPELPGFIGTTQRSDFHAAICPAHLFGSPRHTPRGRAAWISLVTAATSCEARTGLRPRAPLRLSPLTRRRAWPALMKSTSAHSHSDNISGLNTFTAWLPAIAIGPRFLSCLRINAAVTLRAARLDTGPVASRYPGGILPRLSRHHCQVASFIPLFDRCVFEQERAPGSVVAQPQLPIGEECSRPPT